MFLNKILRKALGQTRGNLWTRLWTISAPLLLRDNNNHTILTLSS